MNSSLPTVRNASCTLYRYSRQDPCLPYCRTDRRSRRYVLVVRAAVHTDYEHIYIIVTEAAAVALVAHLRQCKALYRLPVILNIACRAEKMSAALSYPLVYIIITPVASGEHYRSAAVSEGGRHTLVEYLAGYMYGLIAIVIFQVVNAPLCERFCVLKFVLKAAGVTAQVCVPAHE